MVYQYSLFHIGTDLKFDVVLNVLAIFFGVCFGFVHDVDQVLQSSEEGDNGIFKEWLRACS